MSSEPGIRRQLPAPSFRHRLGAFASLREPLLLLALSAIGCSPQGWLMRPKVEKVRPEFQHIGWDGVDVDFRVQVRNPNYLRLRTPRFRCGLEVEGVEFLTTDQPAQFDLPARSAATLALPTRISYRRLWQAYQKLRDANEGEYRLRGTLLFRVLGRELEVPLAHSGKFPVLRMPRFTALRLGFARTGLTRLKLTVEVEVVNRNAFPVDLRDLGYVLQLGDTRLGGLTASTGGTIGPGQAGTVTLTGEVSATSAALGLLGGTHVRDAHLLPTGLLKTPYGTVNLDKPPGDRHDGVR